MNNKSLYNSLAEYAKTDNYPFHMPGHKRNGEIINMVNPYEIDITEIDDFDDLHHSNGLIQNISEKICKTYDVKNSYLLINGSSCGILAGICAVAVEGDEILIARNCHKAVYNAVEIRKLKSSYIYPEINKEYGFFEKIEPEVVEAALNNNKNIKAVVITSPTYEGIVSNIEEIAKVVHKNGGILIVDEAHGAHFCLNEHFPDSAIKNGADIVIRSVHKTLPAMTQTAIMHINEKTVLKDKIQKYLGIFETSSPSYVLMSSVDKCFDYLKDYGKDAFENYWKLLLDFYHEAAFLKNISILGNRIDDKLGDKSYDYGKLVILVNRDVALQGLDYNGQRLHDELRKVYHLQMEMASSRYVIAMTSVCDTKSGFERLLLALKKIDNALEKKKDFGGERNSYSYEILPLQKKFVFEIENLPKEYVAVKNSCGKMAGEYIYLYPPGSPIIVPGEVFDKKVISQILDYMKQGLNIIGMKENKVAIVSEN